MRARFLTTALLLACAGAASAQVSDAPRAKRRPLPPPTAAAAASATPVPATPEGRLALGGLAGLPGGSGDGGASCRSVCARTRYACEVSEDACAAPWVACMRSCRDLPRPQAAASLPR